MKKTLMALAAVATLAVSAVAAPAPAHAQRGFGAGLAAGVIGGAIVGGALAAPGYYAYGPRYYGPGYGYYGGPGYVADGYYGSCSWQRQRFWDGYRLAVSQRAGLRLIPFIFVKKGPRRPRKTARFPGRFVSMA